MVIFGPDLSHWQSDVDLATVAAEGCRFVICKVSQGTNSRDPAWPGFRDDARKAGLILAGFHMITGESAAAQAVNCKAALGDTTIPLALDWEQSGGSGDWSNFLAVLEAFRAAGLQVRLAYCPRWFWQQQGSPDMRAAGLPLWASRYVSSAAAAPAVMYPAVRDEQWTGYGGLQVALLQFTDRAYIAGKAIDCSAYRGTEQQLRDLLYPPAQNPGADDVQLSDRIPDLYTDGPTDTLTVGDTIAWAAAHAAHARDAATLALAEVRALRAEVAALRTALGK